LRSLRGGSVLSFLAGIPSGRPVHVYPSRLTLTNCNEKQKGAKKLIQAPFTSFANQQFCNIMR